ncbi:bifunctional alpha,alpha-trehalose-phosphate synthase (UDP-forming)/trehalose-phosphatase [Candidatus Saccharibacteria bacterium]|nr:bifunctional alpha,alpha-trehalose-phosphate synthase (UDP-forming)/trehalose-phosphatase [Candidatus Saccharibacteria bacterium]
MKQTNNNLIIISTRLPVTVEKKNGKLHYNKSSGGLATGLSSLPSGKTTWLGWPGISKEELTSNEISEATAKLKEMGCVPVFLNNKQIDNFYSGYCNSTLWPLFHYFVQRANYKSSYWTAYQSVNKLFTQATIKLADTNSNIWVHDYQLMLMPSMLRKSLKTNKIGFFMHTPFPSYEIFRLLPERESVLSGLLGANLIGFHTYDYVRHFLSSVLRILGLENSLGRIHLEDGTTVQTDAFPIGVDYKKFEQAGNNRLAKSTVKKLTKKSAGKKVILSVDRADYSKGIPERLDAYELFLKQNPEYHEKLNYIILAVPSREDIDEYQKLVTEIEQKISHINGRYGSLQWQPISYINQSVSFKELTSLYRVADIMLVTPLRDGMNLVAKEYIASTGKKSGVLILSELAGAATELLEAIQINPNDNKMVADSIKTALEMSPKEQKMRLSKMQNRVKRYSIETWASDFINKLDQTSNKKSSSKMPELSRQNMIKDYSQASRRLLLLDYDGTLKDFVATPDEKLARPDEQLLKTLEKLASNSKNRVVIISGRPKKILNKWFKSKNIELVAEHGAWHRNKSKWSKVTSAKQDWKKPAIKILESFADRTPSALIEEKDFAIAWHYREVLPELAYVRERELKNELKQLTVDNHIGIFEGNKILEIKPTNLQKGVVVQKYLREHDWDFIVAIGDDYTDEDMFNVLSEPAYTINVGSGATEAGYQVKSVKDVRDLLKDMAKET